MFLVVVILLLMAKKAKELIGCQVWPADMPANIAPLVGFGVH